MSRLAAPRKVALAVLCLLAPALMASTCAGDLEDTENPVNCSSTTGSLVDDVPTDITDFTDIEAAAEVSEQPETWISDERPFGEPVDYDRESDGPIIPDTYLIDGTCDGRFRGDLVGEPGALAAIRVGARAGDTSLTPDSEGWFEMRDGGAYSLDVTLGAGGCHRYAMSITIECGVGLGESVEICGNGIDDDGNGFADCVDAACVCACDDDTLFEDGDDNAPGNTIDLRDSAPSGYFRGVYPELVAGIDSTTGGADSDHFRIRTCPGSRGTIGYAVAETAGSDLRFATPLSETEFRAAGESYVTEIDCDGNIDFCEYSVEVSAVPRDEGGIVECVPYQLAIDATCGCDGTDDRDNDACGEAEAVDRLAGGTAEVGGSLFSPFGRDDQPDDGVDRSRDQEWISESICPGGSLQVVVEVPDSQTTPYQIDVYDAVPDCTDLSLDDDVAASSQRVVGDLAAGTLVVDNPGRDASRDVWLRIAALQAESCLDYTVTLSEQGCAEVCGNGEDDDGDSQIDCDDTDCLGDPACAGVCPTGAFDGIRSAIPPLSTDAIAHSLWIPEGLLEPVDVVLEGQSSFVLQWGACAGAQTEVVIDTAPGTVPAWVYYFDGDGTATDPERLADSGLSYADEFRADGFMYVGIGTNEPNACEVATVDVRSMIAPDGGTNYTESAAATASLTGEAQVVLDSLNDRYWSFEIPADLREGCTLDIAFEGLDEVDLDVAHPRGFDPVGVELGRLSYGLEADRDAGERLVAGFRLVAEFKEGDASIECADVTITSRITCPVTPVDEDCSTPGDEDGDGDADCADSDCVDEPECAPTPEDCSTPGDEDGDGDADCADSDCADRPECSTTPENCDVEGDEDEDGDADCADSDCASVCCVDPDTGVPPEGYVEVMWGSVLPGGSGGLCFEDACGNVASLLGEPIWDRENYEEFFGSGAYSIPHALPPTLIPQNLAGTIETYHMPDVVFDLGDAVCPDTDFDRVTYPTGTPLIEDGDTPPLAILAGIRSSDLDRYIPADECGIGYDERCADDRLPRIHVFATSGCTPDPAHAMVRVINLSPNSESISVSFIPQGGTAINPWGAVPFGVATEYHAVPPIDDFGVAGGDWVISDGSGAEITTERNFAPRGAGSTSQVPFNGTCASLVIGYQQADSRLAGGGMLVVESPILCSFLPIGDASGDVPSELLWPACGG